jgi:hypothetical protein
VRRGRLTRLERGTQGGREREEMAEVFLNSMARLRVLADGEEPPPEHPRASAPRYRGTVCGGVHRIAGGGSGPVPDLSEP